MCRISSRVQLQPWNLYLRQVQLGSRVIDALLYFVSVAYQLFSLLQTVANRTRQENGEGQFPSGLERDDSVTAQAAHISGSSTERRW